MSSFRKKLSARQKRRHDRKHWRKVVRKDTLLMISHLRWLHRNKGSRFAAFRCWIISNQFADPDVSRWPLAQIWDVTHEAIAGATHLTTSAGGSYRN